MGCIATKTVQEPPVSAVVIARVAPLILLTEGFK